MTQIFDFIAHVDKHLQTFAEQHGPLIYALLFAIVFCETGLVVTPFLPGDSLLFAVGALAAQGFMRIEIIIPLLVCAAILGDNVNYWIGRLAGRWMMKTFPRIVKKEYIDKTHHFFQKYGGKTIIIARFLPIVRTFAPFVAGMGHMDAKKFMSFNVTGAVLWVGLLIPAGYFFGSIPVVKENFELVVFGIIGFSLLPMVIEFLKHKLAKRTENS